MTNRVPGAGIGAPSLRRDGMPSPFGQFGQDTSAPRITGRVLVRAVECAGPARATEPPRIALNAIAISRLTRDRTAHWRERISEIEGFATAPRLRYGDAFERGRSA
jgi:hypothetical protein